MSLPSDEQWKPIPGYEGYYEVSDRGQVKSVARVCHDAIGRHRHLRERLLTLQFDETKGRYSVKLATQFRPPKWHTVSVLVLEAFTGPRPANMECCHNDGVATDDRLENLRWDSPSENRYDSVRHGTHQMTLRSRCPYGHALAEPNLVRANLTRTRNPGRTCLACSRARAVEQKARAQGGELDHQITADEKYALIMGR